MRKLSLFVALMLFALAGSAQAQDGTPAADPGAAPAAAATELPPAAAAAESKMQLGIAFLPMLLGKAAAGSSGDNTSYDMSLAYGVGLSFGYNVIAGLSVGVAPQVLFRVKTKEESKSWKEYDLMARIAYAYNVIPKLAVYAEFLPGYSIISFPSSKTFFGKVPTPKGLVLGFGAGAAYDVTDQFFVNLGVGYQIGY
jgi:hypothetical protein